MSSRTGTLRVGRQGSRDKISLGQWGPHGVREHQSSYPGVGHQQVPHCVALTLLLFLQLHRDVSVGHGAIGRPVLGTLLLRKHQRRAQGEDPTFFPMGLDRRIFWQLPNTRWDPTGFTNSQNHGPLRVIPSQTPAICLFISLVFSAADPENLPGLSPPALSASLWSRISTPRSSSRSPLSCAAEALGWRCRNPSGDNPGIWEQGQGTSRRNLLDMAGLSSSV